MKARTNPLELITIFGFLKKTEKEVTPISKKTKRPKKIDLWYEGWGEEIVGFDNEWEDNGKELDEGNWEEDE